MIDYLVLNIDPRLADKRASKNKSETAHNAVSPQYLN